MLLTRFFVTALCAGFIFLNFPIVSFSADKDHTHDQLEAQDEPHEEHSGDHKDEHDGEHSKEEGGGHGDEHDEESSDAELSDVQLRMAGIETMVVQRKSLGVAITAPGEVVLNAYRTTKVTPRMSAQVLKRHVRIGAHVSKDQPLVDLSSVEMAEAQGELVEAKVELRRIEKIKRNVISEQRYVSAKISYQKAYAKARAYGMTKSQINALLKSGNASQATGEFALLASQDGTIISDKFIVGEIIEPGRVLFEISDESMLWVEARLTPDAAAGIELGAPARVQVGKHWLTGKVTQSRHTLDEATRTLAVHVEVSNLDDALHPGQFVSVVIEGKHKQEGIVVPLAAVMRSADGDWQLFVETAPGRFGAKEVDVLQTVGDQLLIDGIAEGTTIVSKGAFFVQSEIAKSGFNIHNH